MVPVLHSLLGEDDNGGRDQESGKTVMSLSGAGLYTTLLFLATWGFASLMGNIARIRGWNRTKTVWLSAVLFAVLAIVLWFIGVGVLSDVQIPFLSTILLVLALTAIISPLVILVLKRIYPASFVKASPQPGSKPVVTKPVREEQKQKPESVSQLPASPVKKQASVFQRVTASVKKPDTQVFISYRRSDSADISGRIYDRLVAKFGRKAIFKDVDSIPLGIDFKAHLDQQVGKCTVQLVIIGDRWLDASLSGGKKRLDDPADFVRIEIESALERDIPVIPLLVRGASMPSEESLPHSLRQLVFRNGIPIRSDPDFHRDMDRLIAGLEKYVK
jgi:hypothetical protein